MKKPMKKWGRIIFPCLLVIILYVWFSQGDSNNPDPCEKCAPTSDENFLTDDYFRSTK